MSPVRRYNLHTSFSHLLYLQLQVLLYLEVCVCGCVYMCGCMGLSGHGCVSKAVGALDTTVFDPSFLSPAFSPLHVAIHDFYQWTHLILCNTQPDLCAYILLFHSTAIYTVSINTVYNVIGSCILRGIRRGVCVHWCVGLSGRVGDHSCFLIAKPRIQSCHITHTHTHTHTNPPIVNAPLLTDYTAQLVASL